MICEDILLMKQLQGIRLVAGKKGLNRHVRWIYFADCLECINDLQDPAEWINGGELIVITNESLTLNEQKLLTLIRSTNTKSVAGFIINAGQIADTVKTLADELAIPLFEITLEVRLVDLSQIICKALIEEESKENTLDHILFTILYSQKLSTIDLIYQAKHYGVDLRQKCRIIVFDINSFVEDSKKENSKDKLTKIIKSEFRSININNIMTLIQNDLIIMLLPIEVLKDEKLTPIINNIIIKIKNSNQYSLVTVGIGNRYEYIEEMKQSLQEAIKAAQVAHFSDSLSPIVFYKNIGLFSLLMNIEDERVLDNYYLGYLAPLIESDKGQEGNLCKTLETYIKCNGNANLAANALYIHRNTMRYRLDKIKAIVEKDINNSDIFMEINLAFRIKKFREAQKNL